MDNPDKLVHNSWAFCYQVSSTKRPEAERLCLEERGILSVTQEWPILSLNSVSKKIKLIKQGNNYSEVV